LHTYYFVRILSTFLYNAFVFIATGFTTPYYYNAIGDNEHIITEDTTSSDGHGLDVGNVTNVGTCYSALIASHKRDPRSSLVQKSKRKLSLVFKKNKTKFKSVHSVS
jgi:hypothetical protein